MTAGRWVRALRAAVFAAVCVLLAALGHVLMSGSDVPAWALAGGGAATGAAGWCLARRERGLPLILTVVVAAQAVLHEAFSYARPVSGASAGPAAMDMSGMGSMAMGSMGTGSMAMGSMGTGSMAMGSLGMGSMGASPMDRTGYSPGGGSHSLGMVAAHLLAALLCGLWLAHGERAAFRILRAAAGRLVAPLRLLLALPVTPDRPRVRIRRRSSDRVPRALLLVHAITSRGPPVDTAVV